jgi:molybdopterin synthase sulfur carrier subunit
MPTVKLYANLRSITGGKDLQIPGESIREILDALLREYPAIRPFLFVEEQLRPRVMLTLNGQSLNTQTCMEQPLAGQDQIAIFPPVAGG